MKQLKKRAMSPFQQGPIPPPCAPCWCGSMGNDTQNASDRNAGPSTPQPYGEPVDFR